jgi:hypothetical protein
VKLVRGPLRRDFCQDLNRVCACVFVDFVDEEGGDPEPIFSAQWLVAPSSSGGGRELLLSLQLVILTSVPHLTSHPLQVSI